LKIKAKPVTYADPAWVGRTLRRRLQSMVLVVVVSSAIAVLLTLMGDRYAIAPMELIVSNSIGFSIWLIIEALQFLSRGRIGPLAVTCIAVPLGVIIGGKLTALFGAYDFIAGWTADPGNQWKSIITTLIFAASATAFIILFWRASNYRVELETERRRSAEAGRSQAIAELGLLQAQIEPHFLFNTLAHVQSAIEEDPALGKVMLEHLIRYLRGTLRRSRQSSYALSEELDLIRSLLEIARIRLGQRLHFHIEADDAARTARLAPLLLQPLVENAIKHGIEPAVAGGEIHVSCEVKGSELVLKVRDTGVGIAAVAAKGVGLSNVQARLSSLYGEGGRLSMHAVEPHGTVAELRIPL
jgi:signal transduction histidine kinase